MEKIVKYVNRAFITEDKVQSCHYGTHSIVLVAILHLSIHHYLTLSHG